MFEIGEKVIIVTRLHFYGFPGVIKRQVDENRWSVHVTIPKDQQRPSEDNPDYVLKEFTGVFHEDELTSLKNG